MALRRVACRSTVFLFLPWVDSDLSGSRGLPFLEVGALPDACSQVVPHRGRILIAAGDMPAAAEPAADAAPGVARSVSGPPIDAVQPRLIALEAGAPDRVGGVGVHGGRPLDS